MFMFMFILLIPLPLFPILPLLLPARPPKSSSAILKSCKNSLITSLSLPLIFHPSLFFTPLSVFARNFILFFLSLSSFSFFFLLPSSSFSRCYPFLLSSRNLAYSPNFPLLLASSFPLRKKKEQHFSFPPPFPLPSPPSSLSSIDPSRSSENPT